MYQRYVQHIVFREKCRGEKCEWAEAAVICGMWWMTDSAGGGGPHPGACRDSHPDPVQWPGEWEEERERKTDKQRAMAWCGGRKKGRKRNGKRKKKQKKKRGSTCFNVSRQRDEGHGRRGRWVSEWDWSIIYLSSIFLALIPLSFFPSISLFPRLCPAVSSFSWECSEGK